MASRSSPNRNGRVIPRESLPAEKDREELAAPGVYVLVGTAAAGELPTILIGAADPVGERLELEAAEQEFWTSAIIFTSKKRSAQPIPHPLYRRAPDAAGPAGQSLPARRPESARVADPGRSGSVRRRNVPGAHAQHLPAARTERLRGAVSCTGSVKGKWLFPAKVMQECVRKV